MAQNLLTYPRFLSFLLQLKLLNLTSRFPPLPGGVLDEQTRLARQAQIVLGETSLDQLIPARARLNFHNSFRTLKSVGGLFEKVDSTRHLAIPSPAGPIPARLYLPGPAKGYPLFLFFHGGGFVIGDLSTGDNIARFICRRAGCAVLSVEYRLAPEYPFPAAVEDCFTAAAWAVEHASDLCADPARVLVGGDSAGATLAAVVCQLSRRQGAPALTGQALFYPATDSTDLNTPSYREFGGPFLGLPKRDMEWFLQQYAPEPEQRLEPRCSPLLAADFHGLPPALVVTAEFDVLRDEGEAYARCLHACGVPVRLMRCNGMVHGFLSYIGLLRRPTMYFDEIVEEIKRMAAGEPLISPDITGKPEQFKQISS